MAKKSKAFQVCFSMITDENIRTNKSPQELQELISMKELFEEVFPLDDKQYKKWWNDVNSRSDLSRDDAMEVHYSEDDFHLLLNIRDNLRKSGAIK